MAADSISPPSEAELKARAAVIVEMRALRRILAKPCGSASEAMIARAEVSEQERVVHDKIREWAREVEFNDNPR